MNKKLYFLNNEEKERILNLHENRTKNQYLINEKLWGTRYTEPERNQKVYSEFVYNCDKIQSLNTFEDPREIKRKAEEIYNTIGTVTYHLSPLLAGRLKSLIESLETGPNYCIVDRKFMDIVRNKGVSSATWSSGYNNMHEIVSHVFYKNAAWNESFYEPLSELANWGGKETTTPEEKETENKSGSFWANSNLTKNPSVDTEYNCVKYAYKLNAEQGWDSGKDLDSVDIKYIGDSSNEVKPSTPSKEEGAAVKSARKVAEKNKNFGTGLYFYYSSIKSPIGGLRFFSDGMWQSRKDPKQTGEYYCGPGVGLEAVVISSGKKDEGGGKVIPPIPTTIDCTKMGISIITQDKLNNLRKLIGSTETGSSISQNEINLIHNKLTNK